MEKKATQAELELRKFYETDRGERDYYMSRLNLKIPNKNALEVEVKLPMTKDGCEALMELITEALDIPLNDMTRQCFAGYVHHLPKNQSTFTFKDLGNTLLRQKSIDATWLFDQDAKESRKQIEENANKVETAPELQLVGDNAVAEPEQPTPQ